MAKTPESPDYITTTLANRGKLVALDGFLVPEKVEAILSGGGDVDGTRWPDMKFKFAVRDGAAVCVDFHIVSKVGDRPIRTSQLRLIDLDELAKATFEAHAVEQINLDTLEWTKPGDPQVSKQVHKLVEAGYTNRLAELRHVARVFCDPKHRNSRQIAVKEILGYGSLVTANRRIKEARYLSPEPLIPPIDAPPEAYDRQFEKLMKEMENENG